MGSKLEKRRQTILDMLAKIPISTRMQLANATGVSTETIRKDLDALADEGKIIMVHGGVALANASASETPFDMRAKKNVELKRQIAHAAIPLIQKNESIILESCTTSLELAKALLEYPELLETLIVITNSFSIASLFDGGGKCQRLFFLGGWSNPTEYASRGTHTTQMLHDLHANKSFISGAALGKDLNLTCYLDEDMVFQRQAIHCAEQTILMIDSKKMLKSAVFTVCPITEIDCVICDKNCDADIAQAIQDKGVKLIIAD